MSKSVLSHYDRSNLGSTTTRIVTLVSSAEQQSLLRCLNPVTTTRSDTNLLPVCLAQRRYNGTKAEARRRLEELMSFLRAHEAEFGFKVRDHPESELSVHDTNVQLDKGWIQT